MHQYRADRDLSARTGNLRGNERQCHIIRVRAASCRLCGKIRVQIHAPSEKIRFHISLYHNQAGKCNAFRDKKSAGENPRRLLMGYWRNIM